MAHVGQELGLVLARDFELVAFLLDFAEEPRVLDGHRRVRGEDLQQIDRLRQDGLAAPFVVGGEEPHPAPARNHREDDEALRTDRSDLRVGRPQPKLRRERGRFGEDERRAVSVGLAHRPRLDEGDLDSIEVLPLLFGEAGAGKRGEPGLARQDGPDVETVDRDNLPRRFEHAGELVPE